jgi:peptidoglycan-associated lipoprotein
MRNFRTSLIVGAALLGGLALSGCATKEYVDKEVLRVDTLAQGTQTQLQSTQGDLRGTQDTVAAEQARIAAHDAQLAKLDTTTREALQRAEAAGKLAEGKFLYSMVLSDDSVKFPRNKAALSPEAEIRLAGLVEKLKADNRNVYLEIQGHTDATGPAQVNERLGEERAEAVRRYLSKQGVALNRMATISYGAEQPAAPNKTKDGRAQNRRVVVVVLS